MSARRIGSCSRCRQNVYGGDGTPANPGRVNQGGKRVPHQHRKPYTVEPVEPYDDEVRDWEIVSGAWRYI